MATAAILGGGIAGLAAGAALIRAGWQVTVFERAPRLEAAGAALGLWPNAVAGLDRLGLLDAVRCRAAPFTTVLLADRAGRPILPARPVDGVAFMIARADLQEAMVEALPSGVLALGHEVTGVADDGEMAQVRFASGEVRRADLIVDAGGLRSVAADPSAVSYRGYGGVVALSGPIDDAGLDGLAAEYWGWSERFGVFELPGKRRYWFYMRDQAAGAPAPSYDTVRDRAAAFPPAIGRAVVATSPDRLIPFAIHARPTPRRLGSGRVIRVGDAAHAMEPNLGQGACQAIEDAVALGAVARAGPPGAMLAAYERMRLKRVARIVRRSAESRYGAHGPLATQWLVRSVLGMAPSISDKLMRSVQRMPTYAA